MKIIYEMPNLIQKILRVQKIPEGAVLRKSHFSVETDVAEGRLLYHTMTKEFLLLEPEELSAPETQKYLADHWFLVPEETDEKKISNQLKEVAKLLNSRKQKKGIKRFTILTTTECNARCFYCFEHGGKKMTMDKDMAKKVASYISNNSAEDITLSWFGGEPLFNATAIDVICQELKDLGFNYKSMMTSNGYLFDHAIVEKAVNLWNLKLVAITLDGTEEIYNKRKAYIYRDGISAFHRVLDNIETLLSSGIHIRIRLNMDTNNFEDLSNLIDLLLTRFSNYKNLSIYPALIYQEIKNAAPEKHRILHNSYEILQTKLFKAGCLYLPLLRRSIPLNQCMADSNSAVVIQPDGALLSCEHYNECEPWGHIDSTQRDETIINTWRTYMPEEKICATCPLYPNCLRLLHCPALSDICSLPMQKNAILRCRWAMEDAWEKFKSDGIVPDENEDTEQKNQPVL